MDIADQLNSIGIGNQKGSGWVANQSPSYGDNWRMTFTADEFVLALKLEATLRDSGIKCELKAKGKEVFLMVLKEDADSVNDVSIPLAKAAVTALQGAGVAPAMRSEATAKPLPSKPGRKP